MNALQCIEPAIPNGTLSDHQEQAAAAVLEQFRSGQRVVSLQGYAGTGKTTIATEVVRRLNVGSVSYVAPTGRAAKVLSNKGADGARTVHSLIYIPAATVRANLRKLEQERDELAKADRPNRTKLRSLDSRIRAEKIRLDSPSWIRKETSDHPIDLVVIDEASMVGGRLAADLLNHSGSDGYPSVLAIGDPAQLPPVQDTAWLASFAPASVLTEVHRQAAGSPVLELATAIRSSRPGDVTLGARGFAQRRAATDADVFEADQVIVWTNRSRWQWVKALRSLHCYTDDLPMPGEKIVYLANNRDASVLNGEQAVVLASSLDASMPTAVRMRVLGEGGAEREVFAWRSGFQDYNGERDARLNGRDGLIVAATWAAAITAHKAQGSQWPRVLVEDSSAAQVAVQHKRGAADPYLEPRQWLYTAITRAEHSVVLHVRGGR